jgi:translation initiation factor IF-3
MHKKFDQRPRQQNFTRVNFQIRSPMVRVVQDNEEGRRIEVGVMSVDNARRQAQDQCLDLVEIVPTANPPVCAIMDFSKYKYEQKIKEKEKRKKQKQSEMKEIRLSPVCQDHDIDTKVKSVREFLEEGKAVQLTLQFKNRQMAHKDLGFQVIKKVIEKVADLGVAERPPRLEGKRLHCRLLPGKGEVNVSGKGS